MAIKHETKVVFYDSKFQMQQGIERMQSEGWEVVSTEVIKAHYKAGKTCCLGCLFFPLALLEGVNNATGFIYNLISQLILLY